MRSPLKARLPTRRSSFAFGAFEAAGMRPADIKYASIYDSFTITVLLHLEDLGFGEKGQGGRFVQDGNLISGVGRLPFNTDGGGQCNNHPSNRGGLTKVIEAVRQLRGQAHPAVQVKNCDLALAQGLGGWLGTRHCSRHFDPGAERRMSSNDSATPVNPWIAALPESAPYWEGLDRGVLLAKFCEDCGRFHHYPRAICPHCFSARTVWRPTAGRGSIYSFSVMCRIAKPYALAFVWLDEGFAMLTNIVGAEFDALRIGNRVRVLFQDAEDGVTMPVFGLDCAVSEAAQRALDATSGAAR